MPKPTKTQAADIAKRLSGSVSSTEISEFLSCALGEFGGPVGLARSLKECFEQNEESGSLRFRIMDSLIKLMLAKTNGIEEDDDLTTEELEEELRNTLGDE